MDRPMVQLYMGLLAGSILYFAKAYMGSLVVAIWLIIYLVILWKARFKAYLTVVILSFTLLSFINCHIYFYGNQPEGIIDVRVEEARTGFYLGSHNNKEIKIFMGGVKAEEFELGRRYLLKGSFKSKPDYTRGIQGEYYVEEYKPLKVDLIYRSYRLKEEFYGKLSRIVSEEGAGIIVALSCGDSSYLSYDKRQDFNFLGISHIISVSGLHVALIYNLLKTLVGKRVALLLLMVFVVFTGGKASTVRAFIMIVVMVMGVGVRRRYDSISALALAAFIILLMKPYSFLEPGYVLSFLSVLGILLFNGKIARKFYKLPSLINASLSMTLSAMSLTLPYMIFIFENISVNGIISNLLLIPFYTYLLIAGIGMLLFIKIPLIFNLIGYITIAILTIINGIEGLLMDKLPLPLEFTYLNGIIILFLYLSYVLIKKGVTSLKYFPILLMVLVIKEDYIVYPEVNFIAGKKADVVQILHGNENILISTEKVKLRSIYENCGNIDRIYDEFEEKLLIPLKGNYGVKVIKTNKTMEIYLKYKQKVTKFVIKEDNTEKSESAIGVFSYGNYDIIEVEKNEDTINGRYFGTFKVLKGKGYSHYVH